MDSTFTSTPASLLSHNINSSSNESPSVKTPIYSPSKNQSKQMNNVVSPSVHLLAGGLAGCIGAVMTCPMEVVKTRLQSSSHRNAFNQPEFFLKTHLSSSNVAKLSGVRHVVRSIYQKEGLAAFWKGIGPTLLGVIPARAIYFATYTESKRSYTTLNHGIESSSVVMSSAITAGIATALATSPMWLIKTRMQLQSATATPAYLNGWDCLKKVVRNEGFFTLYRGLSASLIGISEGAIQWLIYEKLKKLRAEQQQHHKTQAYQKTIYDLLDYFGFAAVSKFTAAIVTYPHEVIRTRMREVPAPGQAYKYSGIVQSLRLIVREEGVRALYGGMGVHLLRTVPNSAIMFLCYEGIVHFAQPIVHT